MKKIILLVPIILGLGTIYFCRWLAPDVMREMDWEFYFAMGAVSGMAIIGLGKNLD